MTLVVGIECDNGVLMGADSIITNDDYKQLSAESKVFIKNGVLFGFSGSLRFGQILKYHLSIPVFDEESTQENLDRFVVTKIGESLRRCMKEHGFTQDINGRESNEESFGLLGIQSSLYLIQPDFDITRHEEGYVAIGSARYIAFGSLATTESLPFPYNAPYNRIRLALESAEKHSPWVSKPFRIAYI